MTPLQELINERLGVDVTEEGRRILVESKRYNEEKIYHTNYYKN